MELLVELPSWHTAEQIAADLFVSVNTVKTHLRGIYRKLDVRTRRDAITEARARGLL
ncbi:helix-turn-helix domain-containing protein [Rhodococcus sp. MTM3W5.2]